MDPLSSDVHSLQCDPKGFWDAWRKEILAFQCDWRVSTKELLLQAQFKDSDGIHEVRILVDTGAKIFLWHFGRD